MKPKHNNNNNNNDDDDDDDDLKTEIRKLWGIKHLEVVPLVVSALGVVSKGYDT